MIWKFHSIIKNTAFASVIVVLVACSASKFVPDKEYLLEKVEVKTNAKDIDANALRQYIRQHSNSKWFSLFKIPLGTYAMAGRDTSKWINRTLQRFGEKPIIYDTLQARLSCNDLRTALQNMGYMNAIVNLQTKVHRKKIKVIYTLVPGEPFFIRNLKYDIQDKNIAKILMTDDSTKWGLHSGMKFDVSTLDKERNRIAKILTDNGYYHFHKIGRASCRERVFRAV